MIDIKDTLGMECPPEHYPDYGVLVIHPCSPLEVTEVIAIKMNDEDLEG